MLGLEFLALSVLGYLLGLWGPGKPVPTGVKALVAVTAVIAGIVGVLYGATINWPLAVAGISVLAGLLLAAFFKLPASQPHDHDCGCGKKNKKDGGDTPSK